MAKYVWPLPASIAVNQEFGALPGGFNPVGGHTGMDFLAPYGTPVRAIADGVVKHADWFHGTYADNPWWFEPSFGGIVVVIDHGPVLSAYAHLSRTDLAVGAKVRQGDVIGLSGNTRDGNLVFGPHLHLETIPDGWDFTNGTYGRVNPRRYCSDYWSGVSGQSTTITPIPETKDWFDTLNESQLRNIIREEVMASGVAYKNTAIGEKRDVYAILRDTNAKVAELHRDYIQGVTGRNSDGDSFSVLRAILNAVKGKSIDEDARRKKVTGK